MLPLYFISLLGAAISQADARPKLTQRTDPPCALPTIISTGLTWYNSTHNVDCGGNGPDVGNGTICLGTNCAVPVCATGIPSMFNNAPPGYGPPDWLYLDLAGDPVGSFPCNISSLNGLMPFVPIRDGNILKCGSTGRPVQFWGDSNNDVGQGKLSLFRGIQCDAKTSISVVYEAEFDLLCTHDEGFNATCVSSPSVFEVPLVDWVCSGSGCDA